MENLRVVMVYRCNVTNNEGTLQNYWKTNCTINEIKIFLVSKYINTNHIKYSKRNFSFIQRNTQSLIKQKSKLPAKIQTP